MGTNERRRRATLREGVVLVLGVAAIIYGVVWYTQINSERDLVRAVFETAPHSVLKLELAATAAEREKGLMYRKELPADHVMLFLYKEDALQSFWMKDTYLPLDMIFLDKDWRVAGVLPNVPVLSTERRTIERPSRYVLELNAGMAQKLNLKTGAVLKITAGKMPVIR